MRRVGTIRAAVVAAGVMLLGAAPAMAVPAFFDDFGFQDTNLDTLSEVAFDETVNRLTVGEVGPGGTTTLDIGIEGSGDACVLFVTDVCRTSLAGVNGPFSVIVSFEIVSVNTPAIGPNDRFTLYLATLGPMGAPTYLPEEVNVELNPTAPAGLDTGAIPDFRFDGTFTPLIRVRDMDTSFPGDDFHYVGWDVALGEIVSFRYEVLVDPGLRDGPMILSNAVPVAIPEPGTAMLMVLGLLGLASVGRVDRADDA